LLVALVLGLAASITLSETTLVVLALLLLFGRRPARAPGPGWPLRAPMAAFAAWTLVAALASSRPLESLAASKGLLTLGAFYVVLHALPDRRAAGRFADGLFVAVSVVALLSLVQVGFCPPEGTVSGDGGLTRLLFHKCARARTIGDLADDTSRDRLAMLETGLALARAHPLTGVGPGQVKHLYPAWAGPQALRRSTSHLHDTPLQIVVERGLPGLAAWLAIW